MIKRLVGWLRKLTPREIAFGCVALATSGLFVGMVAGTQGFLATIDAVGSAASAVLAAVAVWLTWKGFLKGQDTDQKEYRAYLEITDIGFKVRQQKLRCGVSLRNYGRTPAQEGEITVVMTSYDFGGENARWVSTVTFDQHHPTGDTAKPFECTWFCEAEEPYEFLSFPMEGKFVVFTNITVTYRDVFGTPRDVHTLRRHVLTRVGSNHIDVTE